MTLEAVLKNVTLKEMENSEVEQLKELLAIEKKSVSEMSAELQTLKTELGNNKHESERFTLVKKRFDDRRYMQQPKVHLELEDAENTIAELKEEVAYKASVNRSLALQLEKTIESNSELLLEIKDLDDLLQSREKEIEKLRGINDSANYFEDEKALWMKKLEESEKVIKELKLYIEEHTTHGKTEDIDKLKLDLEKAGRECGEIREENMNLLSQLMNLRHQTNEKDALVHRLESKLATWQDQVPSTENGLEKKLKELQYTVNDLRDKLHLSEELSQSQLDSNKVFLEELSSTVDTLRIKNEQLESMLKKSEESNSSLTQEISMLRKDIIEHEKERSLLMSQRGQMKTLREKISVITQSYETAINTIENLEGVNKTLQEEKDEALAILKKKLTSTEEKLDEMNLQCQVVNKDLTEAQSQLRQKEEEVSFLRNAKEVADASLRSFQLTHKELQDHVNSLLIAKEKADTSLRSSKAAQATLQQKLQELEQICSQRLRQLHEANDDIAKLKDDLERSQDKLQKTYYKLAEAEIDKCGLERRHLDTTEEDQNTNVKASELQQKDIDDLKMSLLASERRVHELNLENAVLAEKLSDVLSEKNEINHRLKSAQQRELELDKKVKDMGRELLDIQNETAVYEQTMTQLESRLQFLGGKRIDQEEKLIVQLQGLTASHHEMLMEKEKAQSCINKLQNDNANLAKELTMWKDKAKSARHQNASLEEKNTSISKSAKKTPELDQKNEIVRLRKHASDLKKKLIEQEEEKDEIKKKMLLFQREVQRKADLLALSEKKLREKEKDDINGGQKPTKHQPKTLHKTMSTGTGMSQSVKAMANLAEKVKFLEEQLNTKNVELEAAKFLLEGKEQLLCKKAEHGTGVRRRGQDERDNWHKQDSVCSQVEQVSQNVASDEAFQKEFRAMQEENRHLRNLLAELTITSKEGNDTYSVEGSVVGSNPEKIEDELREMRDRYSQMSLSFAELQVEKEELLMTIKNLRTATFLAG